MKLFQKILSHGLLIAFFVAVFFLYLYRQSVFPQWFGNEPPAVAQNTESAQQPQVSGQRTQETPQTAEPSRPVEPAESPAVASAPADLPPVVSSNSAGDDLPPVAGDTATSWSRPAADQQLPPQAGDAGVAPEPGVPQQYRSLEQAVDNNETVAPVSAQPDAGAVDETSPVVQHAQQTPAGQPEFRPLQPAQRAATDDTDDTDDTDAASRSGPETRASGQPTGDTIWMSGPDAEVAQQQQQTSQLTDPQRAAANDTASPQYRPAQKPRSYPPAVKAPPAAAQASTVGADAENTDAEFRNQLAQARETFWRGDMRGALQAYRELVAAHPAQADGWGELGNLYLTLGQRSVAADAYYRAISLLIDQDEALRARHLLRVLYGLDSGKAGELEQRLRKVGS